MTGVTVLADDLSGAAESASAFLGRALPLSLSLSGAESQGPDTVTIVDLNTRTIDAEAAQAVLRAALSEVSEDTLLVKKIDSMLRGHIGPEVDVLAERGPVVVAAALPVLRRTVCGGVLFLDGVPLHRSRAWSAEDRAAPHSVATLFGHRPTASIPVGPDLAALLPKAANAGRVAICDASTDADLDAILRVADSIPGAQLVGTSALAAAVARTLPVTAAANAVPPPSDRVLVVVGTAEPHAADQAALLAASGVANVELDVDSLLDGSADPARTAATLDRGHVVLTLRGRVNPARARTLSSALGRYVAVAQSSTRPDLVLTGGETARSVIDALELRTMLPVGEIHHGAVASIASHDRVVVTRPGSFGDADSLVAILAYLLESERASESVHPQQKDTP